MRKVARQYLPSPELLSTLAVGATSTLLAGSFIVMVCAAAIPNFDLAARAAVWCARGLIAFAAAMLFMLYMSRSK